MHQKYRNLNLLVKEVIKCLKKKQLKQGSELVLQDVELQAGICLTGGEQSSDYKYTNAPVGPKCSTPGGFDVKYVNTH